MSRTEFGQDNDTWFIIGFEETCKKRYGHDSGEYKRNMSSHIPYDTEREAIEAAAKRLHNEPQRGAMIVYRAVGRVELPAPQHVYKPIS